MAIIRNLPEKNIKKIVTQIEGILLEAHQKKWRWEINYSQGEKEVFDGSQIRKYEPNNTATLTIHINGGSRDNKDLYRGFGTQGDDWGGGGICSK